MRVIYYILDEPRTEKVRLQDLNSNTRQYIHHTQMILPRTSDTDMSATLTIVPSGLYTKFKHFNALASEADVSNASRNLKNDNTRFGHGTTTLCDMILLGVCIGTDFLVESTFACTHLVVVCVCVCMYVSAPRDMERTSS